MENKKDLLLEKFFESSLQSHQLAKVTGGAWDTRSVGVLEDANGTRVYRDDSGSGVVEHWESDRPNTGGGGATS